MAQDVLVPQQRAAWAPGACPGVIYCCKTKLLATTALPYRCALRVYAYGWVCGDPAANAEHLLLLPLANFGEVSVAFSVVIPVQTEIAPNCGSAHA